MKPTKSGFVPGTMVIKKAKDLVIGTYNGMIRMWGSEIEFADDKERMEIIAKANKNSLVPIDEGDAPIQYCTDQNGLCEFGERCYCTGGGNKKQNVLDQVGDIIYRNRDARNYGPFSDSMKATASVASHITGKDIQAEDVYKILIALKLTRESYGHKDDNLIDAIGYIAGLYDYHNPEQS